MAKPGLVKEGGLSSPPLADAAGRQDPFSFKFFDPFSPIDQHLHRLPHWQQGAFYYFVTWRLADSLPHDQLARWQEQKQNWLRVHPRPWTTKIEVEYHTKLSKAIDRWLDAGAGACQLRDPRTVQIVANALIHFDAQHYLIDSFVIMPNHVHVLFRLLEPLRLESVVQSWKGFSVRQINKHLGRTGKLWQEDYWDRMIRNEPHWNKCWQYILENPVKSKLDPSELILLDRISVERA